MRPTLNAANWKMNKTQADIGPYSQTLRAAAPIVQL